MNSIIVLLIVIILIMLWLVWSIADIEFKITEKNNKNHIKRYIVFHYDNLAYDFEDMFDLNKIIKFYVYDNEYVIKEKEKNIVSMYKYPIKDTTIYFK